MYKIFFCLYYDMFPFAMCMQSYHFVLSNTYNLNLYFLYAVSLNYSYVYISHISLYKQPTYLTTTHIIFLSHESWNCPTAITHITHTRTHMHTHTHTQEREKSELNIHKFRAYLNIFSKRNLCKLKLGTGSRARSGRGDKER